MKSIALPQAGLFGEETVPPKIKHPANGYAARPGTGPKGETCRSCVYLCRIDNRARVYVKCGANRRNWTHGYGSDIRVSSPACSEWQPAKDAKPVVTEECREGKVTELRR